MARCTPSPVSAAKIQRQRGGERFAFAGLHFGDRAMVQGNAAQNLHVEVPHVQRAAAGFANQGVGLGHDSLQRLAAFRPIAQRQAALAKFLVRLCLQFRLKRRHGGNELRPSRQLPFGGRLRPGGYFIEQVLSVRRHRAGFSCKGSGFGVQSRRVRMPGVRSQPSRLRSRLHIVHSLFYDIPAICSGRNLSRDSSIATQNWPTLVDRWQDLPIRIAQTLFPSAHNNTDE